MQTPSLSRNWVQVNRNEYSFKNGVITLKRQIMPKEIYQIVPAKIKGIKNGFRVKYYGRNGEILATSEVLTSLANARKNIKAIISLGEALVLRDI